MAKNWKAGEAAMAIKNGSTEDKLDIGRRFPLFSILVAQTNEAGIELLGTIPDYVTARKLESVLKGDAQPTSDDESEDEVEEEKPEKKEKIAKEAKSKKPAKEEAEDDDEDEEEDKYAGKTAKELFDMAKKAGLKPEPKKTAKTYIAMLEKANAKEEEAEDWGEEDEKPAKKAENPAKKAKAKDEDDEWDV